MTISIKSQTKIFLLFVIPIFGLKSCLVPPAPKADYYKPIADSIVCHRHATYRDYSSLFFGSDRVYYSIYKKNEIIDLNVGVGSTPINKAIVLMIRIRDHKNQIVPIEKLDLTSNRIEIDLKKEKTENDSIFDTLYYQNFKMNDRKWYGGMKKGKDTIFVNIETQDLQKFTIPVYFDGAKTYPACLP